MVVVVVVMMMKIMMLCCDQLRHWMSTGRATTRLHPAPLISAFTCANWRQKNQSKHSRVTPSVFNLSSCHDLFSFTTVFTNSHHVQMCRRSICRYYVCTYLLWCHFYCLQCRSEVVLLSADWSFSYFTDLTRMLCNYHQHMLWCSRWPWTGERKWVNLLAGSLARVVPGPV